MSEIPKVDDLQLTPAGVRIAIRTELPDAVPVTKVNGEELAELNARVEKSLDLAASLTQAELKAALEREAEVQELELEHKERVNGMTPLRLVAKYKKSIGLWGAIGAGAAIISKVAGCF